MSGRRRGGIRRSEIVPEPKLPDWRASWTPRCSKLVNDLQTENPRPLILTRLQMPCGGDHLRSEVGCCPRAGDESPGAAGDGPFIAGKLKSIAQPEARSGPVRQNHKKSQTDIGDQPLAANSKWSSSGKAVVHGSLVVEIAVDQGQISSESACHWPKSNWNWCPEKGGPSDRRCARGEFSLRLISSARRKGFPVLLEEKLPRSRQRP